MIALGLDLSVRSPGFCVLECKTKRAIPEIIDLHHQTFPKLAGHQRISAVCGHMLEAIEKYNPEMVLLEGYVLQKFLNTIVPLVGLGEIARYFLTQHGHGYYDVPPKTLKMFVTGNGNADKPKVIKAVQKRWNVPTEQNDEADAYGLAFMGLAARGMILNLTQQEREILGKLKPISHA